MLKLWQIVLKNLMFNKLEKIVYFLIISAQYNANFVVQNVIFILRYTYINYYSLFVLMWILFDGNNYSFIIPLSAVLSISS